MLCDFDGTLAAIVDDPNAATARPGTVEILRQLARRYPVVAVVSGRPVAFLVDRLGEARGVRLSGLYGLEEATADAAGHWDVRRRPEALEWEPVVAMVTEEATAAAPPGVYVEPKGLSLTVHWRRAPEHGGWVTEWVAQAAARSGLVMHAAKASAELRIPVDRDKGSVVRELSAGLDAVCFVGDDIGDLPAFDAVHADSETAGPRLAVAVRSAEAPDELLASADVVVDADDGVLRFLRRLAEG